MIASDHQDRPPRFLLYLGGQVRQAREEAGLTQDQLARQTFLHVNTLRNIETGKSEPGVYTLLQIAVALEKPITYFLPMPREYQAADDNLPQWMRESLIQMRYITDSTLQRQVFALIKAAAEEQIKQDLEYQDRQLLEDLNQKVARGEKLSRVEKKELSRLKEIYG